MDSEYTLSLSEARARIFDIAEDAQTPQKIYTFTEHGKPKVVLMSASEFESWRETLEVLDEVPDIFERIKEARSKKNLVPFPFHPDQRRRLAKKAKK